MAVKSTTSIALFLSFNILLFTIVSGCSSCPKPKPPPACPPAPKSAPATPTPKTPATPAPKTPATPATPALKTPATPPTPSNEAKCPKDTLKLGACADLLGGLLNLNLGSPSSEPCCSLLQGLADVDAAVCLCTALKANVLGINLNVPISLSLLLNACSKKAPSGFKCS